MRNKRLLTTVAMLLLFIVFPAFLAWNFLLGPVLETNAAYRNLIGKPEADVIAELGQPAYRESSAEAKQHGMDYPWREQQYLPVPDRPVHRQVLLYNTATSSGKTPFAVYVFIGDDGRVEAIDFAGK